jgi:predicted PurR-regulated permease PerM
MHAADAPASRTTSLRIEVSPKTIFVVLGVLAGVWIVGQLATVLTVITVALILVGTFDPVVAWLERRGLRRGRALVLVFVAAALALTAAVLLMVPPLLAQLLDLIEHAPKVRQRIVHGLAGYGWARPLVMAINDLPLDRIGARAGHAMVGYSTALFAIIGYGISTLFLAIYLLADPVRSKGLLYAVVPRHHHLKLAKVLLELKVIVGGYMRGQLITSLAIAAFVFALLTAIGADNALAIALFAGLTDIIPFAGGYIASTPVVIAASPQGTTITLVVVGLMILYQEFESRILVPRVYGRVLRLAPAVVLVSLLVGSTLAGLVGALLALPIAAGLQMLLRELRVDLPGETSPHDVAKQLDERAMEVYEQLTQGVSAADAGIIADDFASTVKRTEDSPDPEPA